MPFQLNNQHITPLFFDRNDKIIACSHILRSLFGMFSPCVRSITWKNWDKTYTLTRDPNSPWKVADDRSIGVAITADGVPVKRFGEFDSLPEDTPLVFGAAFEIPSKHGTVLCNCGFDALDFTVTKDVWTVKTLLEDLNIDDVAVAISRFENVYLKRERGHVALHCKVGGVTFKHVFMDHAHVPRQTGYLPSTEIAEIEELLKKAALAVDALAQ
jgi:hypothetical protein